MLRARRLEYFLKLFWLEFLNWRATAVIAGGIIRGFKDFDMIRISFPSERRVAQSSYVSILVVLTNSKETLFRHAKSLLARTAITAPVFGRLPGSVVAQLKRLSEYLILGCGYTASRVARSLLASGSTVVCTNRKKTEISGADCVSLEATDEVSLSQLSSHLSLGMVVLHSIPDSDATPALLDTLRPFQPSRFVYLSTTGVYGASEFVDEHTVAAPEADRDVKRLQTENLISLGPWSSLILRPAAIYGPDRGMHTSARNGIFRPPPGGNRIISRIHVDDLADHVLAGLRSEITGAFPVADEEPCTALELAEWTFRFLGTPSPISAPENKGRGDLKKGRRVNGLACRQALRLSLRYPSFRQGIPACLAAENSSARPGRLVADL